MNTASGIVFTWFLGLIFLIGGIIFLFTMGDNSVLFGLPYIVVGGLLCYGAFRLQRGARRKALAAAAEAEGDADGDETPEA